MKFIFNNIGFYNLFSRNGIGGSGVSSGKGAGAHSRDDGLKQNFRRRPGLG